MASGKYQNGNRKWRHQPEESWRKLLAACEINLAGWLMNQHRQ